MTQAMPDNLLEWLETSAPQRLTELAEFVSIASVSTDPTHAADVLRAAEWLKRKLERIGVSDVSLVSTPNHPVVLARYVHNDRLPTVIIYAHYDVQPAGSNEEWSSPPFELTEQSDRLYGRGISDDKAPLMIPVWVTQAYLEAGIALPVNLIFLFEGEEEIGSPNLPAVVSEHLSGTAALVVLSADGAAWRADIPSLTTRSRGLVALEFSLSGADRDLHSGRHGGSVQNPLSSLARLVASLHDEEGRVAVKGFYDHVTALPEQERQAWQALPFDDTVYQNDLGVPQLFGETGYSTLERQWGRPTLEVNGLYGGYQGPGSKTVIPREAHAKLSCRLVPNQNPVDILNKVSAHLKEQVPPGVSLTIKAETNGAMAYEMPSDHPVLLEAEQVLAELYGHEVLRVGMGGSIPICDVFKQLNLDTLFFSFAVADENIHAPNEFFRKERLKEGLIAWANLLSRLGDLGLSAS